MCLKYDGFVRGVNLSRGSHVQVKVGNKYYLGEVIALTSDTVFMQCYDSTGKAMIREIVRNRIMSVNAVKPKPVLI